MKSKYVFILLALMFGFSLDASLINHTHKITFEKFLKDYPLRPLPENPSINIVYINFRDDSELVKACAMALGDKLPQKVDYLVILGDKANGLGTLMGDKMNLPWIILTNKETLERKGSSVNYSSITSGNKKMYISGDQMERIKGKNVVILDDVLSTGGTMKAAIELVKTAGGNIQAIACPFTEETKRDGKFEGYDLITLGHLPIYKDGKAL